MSSNGDPVRTSSPSVPRMVHTATGASQPSVTVPSAWTISCVPEAQSASQIEPSPNTTVCAQSLGAVAPDSGGGDAPWLAVAAAVDTGTARATADTTPPVTAAGARGAC